MGGKPGQKPVSASPERWNVDFVMHGDIHGVLINEDIIKAPRTERC